MNMNLSIQSFYIKENSLPLQITKKYVSIGATHASQTSNIKHLKHKGLWTPSTKVNRYMKYKISIF